MQEYPKSASFIGDTPEESYRRYHTARLTPGFDSEHYPSVASFWLHENGKYILVVVYDHDISPNM